MVYHLGVAQQNMHMHTYHGISGGLRPSEGLAQGQKHSLVFEQSRLTQKIREWQRESRAISESKQKELKQSIEYRATA